MCPNIDRTISGKGNSVQPPKPEYPYISDDSKYPPFGDCKQGSFLQPYVPTSPYNTGEPGKPLKAIIYLHGFALGSPQIYEAHLQHLVKQGYFVFFPNYQHCLCTVSPHKLKNILELLYELGEGLKYGSEDWIKAAINSTFEAYKNVEVKPTNKKLIDSNVDTYLFGHSLGGLFALSWPHYLNDTPEQQQKLQPKQVIVADPVPDSLSNLPPAVKDAIEIFFRSSPFLKEKMNIKDTGSSLTVPVALLHGNEDDIVPPRSWTSPFGYIASQKKTMYLSHTDEHGEPPLLANHNQAVTDTSFLYDWMAKKLGGVGAEDDLNWRYIWYALDQVIQDKAEAHDLHFDMGNWSDGQPVHSITRDLTHDLYQRLETLAASLGLAQEDI